MKPSLARVVHYILTEEEKAIVAEYAQTESCTQESNIVAAFIVGCKSNEETAPVNLLIIGEQGGGMLIQNATQGDQPGQWFEPPRV